MRIGLKGKFVNHNFYSAMKGAGFETIADLSRATGLTQTSLGKYLNLKDYPRSVDTCRILEEVLGEPISSMFPEDLVKVLGHKRISATNFYIHSEVKTERLESHHYKNLTYENNETLNSEDRSSILGILNSLTELEQQVIELKYFDDKSKTEIADSLRVSLTRVDQIEAKALRKLRAPKRSNKIKDILYK